MRPRRLEVEGFTAFRELQCVDLSDLELFTITGPTGAGKTSLLDAMIFALYGKVPRARTHLKDLVTLGMAEARVRFEFDLDGERYQVSRRLPRHGAQSATLERWNGSEWRSIVDGGGVRQVNPRIIELLRLDYPAFTKAVVLPQGQFHEFLKGDAAERRAILIDLLGLEQYIAMGRRARGRAKELRTRVETTEKVLEEQFADATEEAVKAKRTEAENAEKEAKAFAKAAGQAQELDERQEQLADAVGELTTGEEQLDELGAGLGDLSQQSLEAQEQEAHCQGAVTDAEKASGRAEHAVESARRRRNELIKRHGTLEKLAQVKEAVESLSTCDAERDKQEGLLSEAGETATQVSGSLDQSSSDLEELEGKAQAAEGEHRTALDAKGAAEKESDRLARSLERVDEAVAEEAAAEIALDEAGARVATAEAELGPAAERLKASEKKSRTLEAEHMAVALGSGLEPGDPCPVCDRPLEAHPALEPVAAKAIESAVKELEETRGLELGARGEVKAAEEALSLARRNSEAAAQKLERSRGEHKNQADLVKAAKAAETAAAKAATAEERAKSKLERARKAETEGQVRVRGLETELRGCERESKLIVANLDEIKKRRERAAKVEKAHFGDPLPKDALERIERQRQEINGAEAHLEECQGEAGDARAEYESKRSELADVRTGLATMDTELAVSRTRIEGLRGGLLSVLEAVGGSAAPVLPRPLKARDKHAARLSEWAETARDAAKAAASAAKKSGDDLGEKLLDLAGSAGLEIKDSGQVSAALKAAETEARGQQRECRAEARGLANRVEQRSKMTAEIADQRSEATLLAALAAELEADRFIDFIQQETLDLLAAKASEELRRISGDRYSLVSEDGDFAVVDHVNAEEKRSVDTLSGGETFMASLSLALALSRHVGELATEGMGANLEAVFIDEGFGALDDETLEDVIDSLERLREGELMVGVITHVKALAERIDEGLRVETHQGRATVELVSAT